MLIGRLEAAMGFVSRMFFQMHSLGEFFTILDTQSAVRDRPGARDAGVLRGAVAFEQVTLSYHGRRPAVTDLAFTAEAGQTVALVGRPGVAKSSSMALISRRWAPHEGPPL